VRALRSTIRAGLRARADATVRAGLVTLIPGARAIGVPVPAMRSFAAELRAGNRTLPLASLADVMDALAAGRVREEILVGTFWLARYGRQLETLPWRRLARWLPALDNWALSLCGPLLADPSPNVRKAVAWALRQASQHDAGAVYAFLRARAAVVPRGVMREGAAKLPADHRSELIERDATPRGLAGRDVREGGG